MSDNNTTALSVKNVSKTFKLPHERHSGLKQAIISRMGGKHQRGYELQHVLKNISFDVKKGEFFGIVGRNGSGKSTLLKLISGIYTPDRGRIEINGSLTPFIELGVGFNQELTGRENVFLNGALMGFSHKEMEAKYDDIVNFAELSDFMDQKLKNYSSGMQVRLAFSISIQSNSDILILDEVLAVGDEAFQRKCNDYFAKVKEDPTKTVILVTHNMSNVKKYCDRAMMLEDGKITSIGNTDEVADSYTIANREMTNKKVGEIITKDGAEISVKPNVSNTTIDFTIKILPKVDIQDALIAFAIMRGKNDWVYWWGNDNRGTDMKVDLKKGVEKTIKVTIQNIFPSGTYKMDYTLVDKNNGNIYAKYTLATDFEVRINESARNTRYWRPNIISVVEK